MTTSPISTFRKIPFFIAGIILVFSLLHIEYDDFKFKNVLYPILWLAIPLVVFKLMPRERSILKSALLITGSGIYILMTFFFGLSLIGFCIWTNHGTEYRNKHDKSITIIRRGYSCYMTDDDAYLFKQRKLTEHIKWVTEFNENPIDTNLWQHEYGD